MVKTAEIYSEFAVKIRINILIKQLTGDFYDV